MPRKNFLKNVKRIVIKIGSSSITENNCISKSKISAIVKDVAALKLKGYEIVIVTSGSISAGAGKLNKNRINSSIPAQQAFAAVGQAILMNEYQQLFHEYGYNVGQILMTEDDVKSRRRFLNARNTLNSLIHFEVIPIVNENDSVVVKELKLGDNDTLSAHVAHIVEADLLIMLSDIDGFYNDLKDPEPLEHIEKITDEIIKRAGGTGSIHGTGGMLTKIRAADMLVKSGEMMIIAFAGIKNVLNRIMDGELIGTLFYGNDNNLCGRKRWIEFNMKSTGKIHIDNGAVNALVNDKKSLLAIGITNIEGDFSVGDAVNIIDDKCNIIGKGIVNYNQIELNKIKGKKSSQIIKILGDNFYNEVLNRDNLIIY